jgi:hypothetical protein
MQLFLVRPHCVAAIPRSKLRGSSFMATFSVCNIQSWNFVIIEDAASIRANHFDRLTSA